MKFNAALNEKIFKNKKINKSYREKLLDDPKYVDDWLKYGDKDLTARIKYDHIQKATPDEVHAKELMNRYYDGEELTQEEWEFIEAIDYDI